MATSEVVKQQSATMEATSAPDTDRVRKRRQLPRLIPNETHQGTETPKIPTRPIAIQTPSFITQEALNLFTYNFHANEHVRKRQARQLFEAKYNRNMSTTPYCAAVIHPINGETIKKYKKLATDPATQAVWTTAFGKEWGNLTQGDNKTRTKGTDSLIVLNHNEIRNIPTDRTVTYANIVVDYRP